VHPENGRHVTGGRQTLTGTDITVCNVTTDFSRDLVVQGKDVISAELDSSHGDNHSVTIVSSTETVLRPASDLVDLELVIREARRRQHRRWLVVGLGLVLVLAAALGGFVAVGRTTQVPQTPASLLTRPLHYPSLGPGRSCPASTATTFHTFFNGIALGSGPVRVLLADTGDISRGRVDLYPEVHGWSGLQTLWFAMPGYNGPFVVRAKSLSGTSPIEVQSSGGGLAPGSGPLVVPGGPTLNTRDGYRTVPGATYVTSPGCYAWQVDGGNFSEIIVVDARSLNSP